MKRKTKKKSKRELPALQEQAPARPAGLVGGAFFAIAVRLNFIDSSALPEHDHNIVDEKTKS